MLTALAQGLLAVAAAAVPASAVEGAGTEVLPLSPGTPVEGEIRGAERKAFRVVARTGDVLRVMVDQRGVDLVLAVSDPRARVLLEADDVPGAVGTETAAWIAETDGEYQLELRGRLDRGTGSYRVKAEDPRPATAADRDRAAAAQALSEGARLLVEAKAETRRLALAEYETALGLFRRSGDPRGEALALAGMGTAAHALADFGPSLQYLQDALVRWRSIGDRWQQGLVLSRLGILARDQTKGDEGAAHLEEALAAFRDTGDRRYEAEVLSNIGTCYETAGDGPRAQEAYEQALALWRALGDRPFEATVLHNLGARAWSAGDYGAALDRFLEELSVGHATGDRSREASALMGVGTVYNELGDPPRALHHLEQALAFLRESGNRPSELAAVAAIGYAHRMAGALDKAREAYLQAVEMATGLGHYGRRVAPYLFRNLGIVSLEAGELKTAREYLERSLARWRETSDVGEQAHVLSFLCRVLSQSGDFPGARAHGLEAMRLAEGSGAPKVHVLSLYRMAQLELLAGDPASAAERTSKALELLERSRRSVRSAELRASYVASVREIYDLHVHALMARHAADPTAGFDAQAFQATERGRARSLLELLAESRDNVREGADPGLLDRERSLRERLSAAGARAARASGPEAQQAATREIEGLTTELERTEAEIRVRSPRYAALTQPQPTTVGEVQALLDDETLLLAYALGEEGSYAWLIGRRSVHSARLPPRAAINEAARKAMAGLESERGTPKAAALELSRLVLEPLAGRTLSRRLVVVADGALQYVPFAALPDLRDGTPLVARHEVVGLPSASTLALLRRDRTGRPPADKTVAVLADPVFEPTDERLGGSRRSGEVRQAVTEAGSGRLTRATEAVGLGGVIPRLPFTRREARAILAVVPPRSSLAALDFEASRATVTDPTLARYRLVHFATHGFLNAARPELSGILLSLFGRDGLPQPGFLTAADAFNLKLSADLVVLSGCRTALGKEIRGEGMVGLTRGFMYAGADAVMASLWKVDDAATAALMTRFYRAMLGPRRLPPAAALRAAQLEMRGQPRYRHPYYWAAFQLQGRWD